MGVGSHHLLFKMDVLILAACLAATYNVDEAKFKNCNQTATPWETAEEMQYCMCTTDEK